MLAYYLTSVSHMNRCIFFCITGAYQKVFKLSLENAEDMRGSAAGSFIHFVYPIFNWVWTKYQSRLMTYFAPSHFIFLSSTAIEPLTYFYRTFKPGTIFGKWLTHSSNNHFFCFQAPL